MCARFTVEFILEDFRAHYFDYRAVLFFHWPRAMRSLEISLCSKSSVMVFLDRNHQVQNRAKKIRSTCCESLTKVIMELWCEGLRLRYFFQNHEGVFLCKCYLTSSNSSSLIVFRATTSTFDLPSTTPKPFYNVPFLSCADHTFMKLSSVFLSINKNVIYGSLLCWITYSRVASQCCKWRALRLLGIFFCIG